MRAVCMDGPGGPEVLYLGEVPDPVPGEGEVLVRVKATALNRADLLQRRGGYPPPAGASPILGLEAAGVVEAVGGGCRAVRPGDRVMALLPGGGYAERVVVPEEMAMPIPASFSFEEAAAVPEVWLTAYLNLILLGGLRPGQDVLIHAGASGVGTAAIQIVREWGARAHVTAGSPEKLRVCLELGAATAVNYKEGPFAPKVLEATGGRGVDIILDFVGAPYWEQNLSCLATEGKLFLVGTMGGSTVREVNLGQLLFRRISVIGTSLRSRSVEDKIRLTRSFREWALPRFEDGRLKPVIDRVFPWEEVKEAHRYMESNRNIGKIVLKVD
ncbi:MAG: NAD(P)H-quinone oxidoreductase [Alicyclobacillaceae bacterium]|nr:NAD(P)H-quinone oxidoreductase [Alicyclobacillaceae bacterium]